MRRRTGILLLLFALGGITVFIGRGRVWTPLDGLTVVARSPLAAPLRTGPEHDEIYGRAEWPYRVEVRAASGNGTLVYLGTTHVTADKDPSCMAQLDAIRAAFEALKPERVLIEGRLGWHFGDRESAVRRFGEAGFTAALARESGVTLTSLESQEADEVADAVATHGEERVLAFYFLRVFVGDRERGELGDDIDAAAAGLLAKRGARTGLTHTFADLAAFDGFWSRERPSEVDWRSLPAESLWRRKDGTWLNVVAERINAFRDEHMVAVLLDCVERGERVLAVCGASHVILQEPALRAGMHSVTPK